MFLGAKTVVPKPFFPPVLYTSYCGRWTGHINTDVAQKPILPYKIASRTGKAIFLPLELFQTEIFALLLCQDIQYCVILFNAEAQ